MHRFAFNLWLVVLGACSSSGPNVSADTDTLADTDVAPEDTDVAPEDTDVPLDADGDGVPADRDCDDDDDAVYPGADDSLCDGRDLDCDGRDALDGVIWTGDDGTVIDHTADATVWPRTSPGAFVLDTPGELRICADSLSATIDVTASNVRILGDAIRSEKAVVDLVLVREWLVVRAEATGVVVSDLHVACERCDQVAWVRGGLEMSRSIVDGQNRTTLGIGYGADANVVLDTTDVVGVLSTIGPKFAIGRATGTLRGAPGFAMSSQGSMNLVGAWRMEGLDLSAGSGGIRVVESLALEGTILHASGDDSVFDLQTGSELTVDDSTLRGNFLVEAEAGTTVTIRDSALDGAEASSVTLGGVVRGSRVSLTVERTTAHQFDRAAFTLTDPVSARFEDVTFTRTASASHTTNLGEPLIRLTDSGSPASDPQEVSLVDCTFDSVRERHSLATGSVLQSSGIPVRFEGGAVLDNSSEDTAGVVFVENADVTIDGTSFRRNLLLACGGALRVLDASLSISDAVFEDNVAIRAGAVCVERSVPGAGTVNVVFTDTEFLGNASNTDHGAVLLDGVDRAELEDVSFVGNDAHDDSGALTVDADVTETRGSLVLTDNEAGGVAAAMRVHQSATVRGMSLKRNTAAGTCGSAVLLHLEDDEAVTFDQADFAEGADENDPGDVRVQGAGCIPGRWTGVETVTCTAAGCVAP